MAFDSLRSLPPERRWRAQAHPTPVVVALIPRQLPGSLTEAAEHYLLIKRRGNPYDGHWALVGGKWDFGETLSQAIIREVKEETALDASFVALRGLVSERVVPHQQADGAAHFLIFVCELNAPVGRATEQDEGALGWFTLEQIDELRTNGTIIPSDYAMIKSFTSDKAVTHVEAEMRAPIDGAAQQPIQLLRFDRVGGSA